MVKVQQGKWVVPNPQIPRSFGIMNIVFGSLLLLTGVSIAVWAHYAPKFVRGIQQRVKAQRDSIKAEHDAKVAELKKQEAAAKTKEEKESLLAERIVLEQTGAPRGPVVADVSSLDAMSDWRVTVYNVSEFSTGILFNVLMIVSGAGLLGPREWGRRLAIWVAELKILRWVLMTVITMVVIIPISMEASQKAVDAGLKAQGGQATGLPMPMTDLVLIGMIFSAVLMVFSAIVASVYPALSIWFLTRPAARVACMNQPEPELPEPDPQWETTA